MNNNLNQILKRIEDVTGKSVKRLSNGTYQCHCPAHDDDKRSLSVSVGQKKNVVLYCHAGCDYIDILKALRLVKADLDPIKDEEPERRYDYHDENGNLIFQTIKKPGKKFLQRHINEKGNWVWDLKGVQPVPYRLPEVLQTRGNNGLIFIVEGEKDVETLRGYGFVATTNPLGAGKWRKAYNNYFEGAQVIVIPDNDQPGIQHAVRIATGVKEFANSVQLVKLPNLKSKGDVTDWLEEGHTVDELVEIISNTPTFEPPDPGEIIDIDAEGYRKTDAGNALRFINQYKDDFLYDHNRGKWMIWNECKWKIDEKNYVIEAAKNVINNIFIEANEADDPDDRQKLIKHAMRSEQENRINAMINLAKTNQEIATKNVDFDNDPYIINTKNGYFDLKEFKLKPHDRNIRCNKVLNTIYDESAEWDYWDSFLDRIFEGNTGMINFLSRAIGLSLSGIIDEQVLFFCYGIGANGKSTFFEAMRLLFNDYFLKAPTDMLLMKREGGSASNDVAMLQGARFVVASEMPGNRRLNEQVVKDLTGGDRITARFLFREYFQFDPTHKLWMYGNHKPRIVDTDEGIWRRVKILPFMAVIGKEERKPMNKILNNFKSELPGILNWVIKGYKDYLEHGLDLPKEVVEATKEYREDSDVLGNYINEKCIVMPTVEQDLKSLYNDYVTWCEENKEYNLRKHSFSKALIERGFKKENTTNNKVVMRGIGLHGGFGENWE